MKIHCSYLQTHQKRTSDPITDGCEPPCGGWDLNSGPLEQQSVLLTAEPSLQPPWAYFLRPPKILTTQAKAPIIGISKGLVTVFRPQGPCLTCLEEAGPSS